MPALFFTILVALCTILFVSPGTPSNNLNTWKSDNEKIGPTVQVHPEGDSQGDYPIEDGHAHFHPLEPLSEFEINLTSAIIRNSRRGNWMFHYISLIEPEKAVLLPYFLSNRNPPALSISRKSFAVLTDARYNQAHEIVVNLDTRRVESWRVAPSDVEVLPTTEEFLRTEAILRQHEGVVERCRKLGWTNMSLVKGDQWPLGYTGDNPEFEGKRIVQAYLYGQKFEGDNSYAHPFDFVAVVDLAKGKVIALEDLPTHEDYDASNKKGNTVPSLNANYDPDLRNPESLRQDLRPVHISQPGGASFTVTGHKVEWQKFKMRIGFNGREGMVIHNVVYNDNGAMRPLFYRISMPEMFVPYGDARPPFHRKFAFDAGQLGLGYVTNQLQSQIDCVGQVHFLDAAINTETGAAKRIPQAICIHEEDAGILWKHTDVRTGKSATTRSQRLAIFFVSTIGNYDYMFTWYFYQDATIEFNVKLTGILSTNLLAVNATPAGFGSVVAPQILAQHHQHIFTVRLDAEIDGSGNSVMVTDVVPLSDGAGSLKNPYGQGITTRRTLLETAYEGHTNVSPQTSRTWHIQNPSNLHSYTKEPVAWKLIPVSSPPSLVRRNSPIHPKAEYLDFNTWVTPYQEDQIFPGGFYLNNSGLPEWIERDRNASIVNTYIVLWHNFGISHVPRVEDFPVMPTESCGVVLKPVNFFKENPALDVKAPL